MTITVTSISRLLNSYSAMIIKYLCRYKTKGGIEDLEKARHYLDMMIELEIKNELDFDGPDLERMTSKKRSFLEENE